MVVAAVLFWLTGPVLAEASYTSMVVGSVATMIGDGADDTLTITQSGGLFSHNRAADPGFNSSIDFDSTVAGDQTMSSATGIININAADGHDSIVLGDGIDLRGVVDGGPGLDTIDYTASTSAVSANLGLGTTGLIATLGSDQENPPNQFIATGTATVSHYDIAAHSFDITVTVTNISPAEVTGVHIHRAVVGVNGPIIVNFNTPLSPAGSGFQFTAIGVTVPAIDEAAFLGGGTYINIRTTVFPDGAIRGQLFSTGNVDWHIGVARGTGGVVNIENVTGGAGADSLVGNFNSNAIDGGGGADWIVGGPGTDNLTGGAGADVLVWSNGDGSDIDEGGADSDTVLVNGNTMLTDFFTVSANGPRVVVERTNFGLFDLDIGTVETLTLNGIGGNDLFTVNDPTGIASLATLNLNGFDGDDDFVFVPASAGAVTVNANGGRGVSDRLQGPNAATTWNVTAPNQGNIAGLVTYQFAEVLVGGTASDLFNAKAFHPFMSGTPTVIGGDGADTLIYDAESRVVLGDLTPPDGTIDSPGAQSLTFAQMETVNIINNRPGTPPTISPIANQSMPANNILGPIPFTVGDLEAPAGILVVSATSSNSMLLPSSRIGLAGAVESRSVTLLPVTNQVGSAIVTLSVSDGIFSTSTSFLVIVAAPTTVQPPQGLYVSAMSGNLVTFRFTPPVLGPPPTGYVFEGATASGAVDAGIAIGSDLPIFSVVVPTGSFYVRMRSIHGADTSDASGEIRIHVNVPVVPSPPDSLRTVVNGSTVVLAWRNTFRGGAPTSLILDVSGPVTTRITLPLTETLTVNGVPPGTYSMRLRAANAAGFGSGDPFFPTVTVPSACAGPPGTPLSFLAYRVGNTANVVWEPTASGPAAASYLLNISGAIDGSLPTTLRALGGPVAPGSYTISVVAVNPCGSSPPTPPQTIVIP
jgi:CHRD domain